MRFLILSAMLLSFAAAGCKSTDPDKPKKPEAAETGDKTKAKKPEPKVAVSGPDFDLFIAELRGAIGQRDMSAIASMMTPTFGYSLEPLGEGDGVFKFWDENQVWDQLQSVVNEEFTPSGAYMVAPRDFQDPNAAYTGYRAGMVKIKGKWKFAYFVNG